MEILTRQEKNEFVQNTIDRLLYCPGYKEQLKALNSRYNPHDKVKFTENITEFKFPLDKAI